VAHLLIELFYGLRRLQALPHGDGVEIPLTQTHIAEALGLTNVHVSKILRELREEGLVVFRGGRLRILQVDRLAELAEFDLGADLCEI
jgi:CRP-like cAMP-binding protein